MAEKKPKRGFKNLLIVIGIGAVLFLLNLWENGQLHGFLLSFQNQRLQLFTIILLAILLDGFPFLLLGAVISGAIEVLVPEETLKKVFPAKNRFLSSLTGSFLGLFFPVCSCGNIPVTRRLIKKGVPLAGALGYLLAAPIVNVITIFSTYTAFPGDHKMLPARFGLALFVAISAGCVLGGAAEKDVLKEEGAEKVCLACCHEDGADESRTGRILHHAGEDFFHTAKFLILGAAAAALFQTLIPRSALLVLASRPVLPIFILGALAIVLCLCSFADAFVASTFTAFSGTAKAVFLVLGPMSNAALIFLYTGIFKKRFAAKLVAWVLGSVFVTAAVWQYVLLKIR